MDEDNVTLEEPLNKNFREPKIRFPEFNDSCVETRINKVSEYSTSQLTISDVKSIGEYKVYDANSFIGYSSKCVGNDYISIVKDGSGVGRVRKLDKGSTVIATLGVIVPRINYDYFYYYFSSIDLNKYIVGSSIPHLYWDEYGNEIIYIPSTSEQQKIGGLFSKIDNKIGIVTDKLETLKKYKEGLIQEGFKLLECNSDKIKFSDLFKPFNIRNKDLLPQYTVGKSGLKLLDEGNYDISNHKTFSNDCLILGIGIEEIGISENLNGSISPVYSVYKIKNPDQTKYFKYFLKPYLWKNKKYFTRKSTRREYEIDSSELSDIKIQVPNNRIFDFLIKSLEAIDDLIEAEEKILDNIISIKNFLLKGMFI